MNQAPNITDILIYAIDTLTNGKQPPTYAMKEAAAQLEMLLNHIKNTPPEMEKTYKILAEINAEIDRHQEEIDNIYKEMS